MAKLKNIWKKWRCYGGNLYHYGVWEGGRMNIQDVLARCYYFFLFHKGEGAIDISGYVYGRKYVEIGRNFSAGRGFRLEAIQIKDSVTSPRVKIGNNVSLSDYCHIGVVNYVEIGNHVLFGSKCYVTDHNHGVYTGDRGGRAAPTSRPRSGRCPVIRK